jgi:class 3 adenylate cyclase
MPDENVHRRLAAIMITDVVGYSRMMGLDEAGTLLALQERRFAVIDPTIGQHEGRIIKSMGDGLLVEFPSIHNAVDCALAIQRGLLRLNSGVEESRQIRLRIGINIGDVMVRDGDLFGEGVNLAARLEQMAEPNGICLSATAHAHVEGDLDVQFTDLGAHELKNIAKPVRVYHYNADETSSPAQAAFRPFIDLPVDRPPLITGGCMCGAVRYEATEKPLGSMICHCRMCQKFSGAPILGGTTFRSAALRFTSGEPKYFRSSAIAERGFCGDCGTALVYRGTLGRWTEWVMIWTASLDEPEKFPPTYHLGIESTMPWLNIHDDLPRTRCKDSPSLVQAYGAVNEDVP